MLLNNILLIQPTVGQVTIESELRCWWSLNWVLIKSRLGGDRAEWFRVLDFEFSTLPLSGFVFSSLKLSSTPCLHYVYSQLVSLQLVGILIDPKGLMK